MSIFNLIEDEKDLPSSNEGVSHFAYSEFTPSKNSTGEAFPQSLFRIPFESSNETWWIPSKSYMRIRCELQKGDSSQLELNSKVAPNINLAANLFQSMELQLNGKTISRCAADVAQVDMLETRLSKSDAWLKSIGASINWLQEDLDERINEVSSDGFDSKNNMEYVSDYLNPDFGFVPATITIETNIQSATPTAGSGLGEAYMLIGNSAGTAVAAANVAAMNALLRPGDKIMFGGDRKGCATVYADDITGDIALLLAAGGGKPASIRILCTFAQDRSVSGGDITTGNALKYNTFTILRPKQSRRISGFEIIYKPMALSIFKYSGAIPGGGKFELICTPHNKDTYKNRAIEVPEYFRDTQLPVFNTLASGVKFEVKDVRFYAAQVVGERVEDKTFYLPLENTRLLTTKLSTSGLVKNYFDVSPLTYALTVAFQNSSAGNDPRHSCSRFRVGSLMTTAATPAKLERPELSLDRMFVTYANRSYPSPDADPKYKAGNADDYSTQRYIETQINSGAFFSEGGGESIQKHQDLGPIHYFQTPKDGQNRSTRVSVNTQFSSSFEGANLLLFEHSQSSCQIVIQRGLVISVEVSET
tara:strand:+ start:650 stop:2416 length:1767 start_codon:yes stop_codon:yes gene_type:complete